MDRVLSIVKKMNRSRIPALAMLRHYYLRTVYACDIMPGTDIGDGTVFSHNGLGVVIHPNARIGRNCNIHQSVTIGGRKGDDAPRVCDGVTIGASALVLGDITVGEGALVGAGAVVIDDVPPCCTAVGNPARVIERRDARGGGDPLREAV